MNAHHLRADVRALLLDLDRSFAPSHPRASDAARHAYRLRFALARLEEQAQAAVMQSELYRQPRFDIALAILKLDIDRARTFLGSARPVQQIDAVAPDEESEAEVAQRAA